MRTLLTRSLACIAFAALVLPGASLADPTGDKPTAAKLEQELVGYWAPDPEDMLKKLKEKVGDDANAEALLPLVTVLMDNMAVEITKGEVTIHTMGQAQTTSYKVIKADPTTKTLTLSVTDDGEIGEGAATLKGDKLTLTKGGETIVLNRISKAAFEKRKAAGGKDLPLEDLPFPR